MKPKGISCSENEVKGFLEHRRTSLWRLIVPQPELRGDLWAWKKRGAVALRMPETELFRVLNEKSPFKAGQELFVKEAFWQAAYYPFTMPSGEPSPERWNWGSLTRYAADGPPENVPNSHYPEGLRSGHSAPDPYATWHLRGPNLMDEKSSRIKLRVRLSEACRVASVTPTDVVRVGIHTATHHKERFAEEWDADRRNKKNLFVTNPFAWRIELERL